MSTAQHSTTSLTPLHTQHSTTDTQQQWKSSGRAAHCHSTHSLTHSLTHRSGTQWQHTHFLTHTHTHTRRYSLLPMINTFNESSSKINESFSTDRDPSELHSPLTASLTHSHSPAPALPPVIPTPRPHSSLPHASLRLAYPGATP